MASFFDWVLPSTYSTNKEVTLLDRKLGLLYVTISLLVFAYVIGVRVVLEQGYAESEIAYGVSGVQLNGTTYTVNSQTGAIVPQDVASLIRSGVEGGAVFLPMRSVVSYGQKVSNCSTPDEPCSDDSDCPRKAPIARGQCLTDVGSCIRTQWCNPGADGSYKDGQTSNPFAGGAVTTNTDVLQDLSRLTITILASVEFNDFGGISLSNDGGGRTRWTISQVLQRAGMTEAEAQQNGAVLDVALTWNCPFISSSTSCVPILKVTQLKNSFYAQWANYYRALPDETVQYRDLYQAMGLRMLVSSTGSGTQISLLMIMQQLFVILALLPIASLLADTIMTQCFSERRHYREYKTEQSPDFSDIRAKVEQLEKQSQSRQAKAMNYA
uniref:Uncharacterized protein n=1 Tax=Haptolina brevifila TaxID=156173 RepID=A0A7S2HAU4_9EUKA|mmetsp:Transcript_52884/g.105086  ORF Transcript_52884/g.105086 Transcript_52884/m.105086 type:complete len:382 (+) Transcript_52884:109-1254(+)|eukprot:CAMPEP_0174727374 /NCGR_PEP_ID=MMETSP1094-20130205/49660_1 /TAXON_ID=156173 /ORGANISM="Chrysochromulina brevifilum, Strain UTEX LB 985" /LENGTH=381 /DNA_ID=CAMNT_0015929099 /DNA_START=107 /DNA_END=1252 /DNA_ORIENTATION=-